jgi:hypothetical protein
MSCTRTAFLLLTAVASTACGPKLALPAVGDSLIGCWSGEDYQPVTQKRMVWFMQRRSDGTFTIEFTPTERGPSASSQTEEGIWTHANGKYTTITQRIAGRAVGTRDPHFTDEYDVSSQSDGTLRYQHRRAQVTFTSKKVPCDPSAA